MGEYVAKSLDDHAHIHRGHPGGYREHGAVVCAVSAFDVADHRPVAKPKLRGRCAGNEANRRFIRRPIDLDHRRVCEDRRHR